MNDYITGVITDPNLYFVISFAMSIVIFSWFFGYAIRLVLSLLYKINNVI